MTILRLVAAHKSLAATVASSVVVAALVTTIAVTSGGYTAQRMELTDGSVWVANQSREVVGRANTEVLELNSTVGSVGRNVEITQNGVDVLVVDRSKSTLGIVDPATSTVSKNVALPPDRPRVLLGGDHIAIHSAKAGNLWVMPLANLPDFKSESEPALRLGADSVISMDAGGTLFAYAPGTGDVSRVEISDPDRIASTQRLPLGTSRTGYRITSVQGQWALLDTATRQLQLPGRTVDLSSLITSNETPVLQTPSVAGTAVYVAHRNGLIEVPLDSGEARELLTDIDGAPAQALQLNGCVYAAWSDGQAWQRCPGDQAAGEVSELEQIRRTAILTFRVNGPRVVLNDARGGETWAVQRDNQLINNWDSLIKEEADREVIEKNESDAPPTAERTQQDPVAVDDEFGARPGRATVLPVLLNDYDPNGDALVISDVSEIGDRGSIDIINNNQQLLLSLPSGADGVLNFEYTITDGRGGQNTARVTVTVRSETVNEPPLQARTSFAEVAAGGRLSLQVLGDWVDPDGDSFYLTSASVTSPDEVSFTRDGTVTYRNASSAGAEVEVRLVVSDGRSEQVGALKIKVKAPGDVPITADTFVVLAYTGQEVTVSPLSHVRGGTGTIRLSSVPAKIGITLTPDYDGGTFRFVGESVGTTYVDYQVTDGDLVHAAQVRVDVLALPDANSKPITVPHSAFIHEQTSAQVDVLAGDFDPAGAVLLITGVHNVPVASGLRVEILEQRILRVTLTKPLEGGSAVFNYQVSNGLAEAEGNVTVVQIPVPIRKQPPVAKPDSVSVRVGDTINIPVLKNDSQPDGDTLALNPTLERGLPTESGLLFASGNRLRYLAPSTPGNYTAVYRVDAPDGQWSTAEVKIAVREVDEASNNPPVPRMVTARVLAGETVRIPIALSGIDPDGDSVQLIGQETSPEKGTVLQLGADWIEYQAGEYSSGTDTFGYAVADALGARASGLIRVGISPRLDGARNPIAVADEVTVRPDTLVSVQVLDNDSNPDGGTLEIIDVTQAGPEQATPIPAEIVGDVVRVQSPAVEGRYSFIYEIQNSRGGTSSNFLTVIVKKDAPLSWPIASDTQLSLSDVLGRSRVDVNVLSNVFFADGNVSDLLLELVPGFPTTATVMPNNIVTVQVEDAGQIIPFQVTHPQDAEIVSYAFIRVPGSTDALPQLRRGVGTLTIASDAQLTIDLNQYVVAAYGRPVRLVNENTVQATNSNGDPLVANESTLVFTGAEGYFGPASIAFEVTDGTSPTDPAGRRATLVLPITVTPRTNQPPVFTGAALEFEPGQEKTIDLVKLTTYPYLNDLPDIVYSIVEPQPVDFSYRLEGPRLTIRASDSAVRGATTAITVGVRDKDSDGQGGRIDLKVVSSTRPLAVPASDRVVVPRGSSISVDVLTNDETTNPFPGVPLQVVAVRGLDGGTLPEGLTITPSGDRSTLSITAANGTAPVDTTLQYQVMDATGSPDRFVWGTVTVSVQDRPAAVNNLEVLSFGNRSIVLSWAPGAFNNSTITGYSVSLTRDNGELFQTTVCTSTTCTLETPGNGSSNRVRVQVRAVNGIGESDPVTFGQPVWSDIVPQPPVNLHTTPLDQGLRVRWGAPPEPEAASRIDSYIVTVGGSRKTVPAAGGFDFSIDFVDVASFVNGVPLDVTVSARNQAFPTLAVWQYATTSGTPYGPPKAGALEVNSTDSDTATVTLTWNAFNPNGDELLGYFAQLLPGDQVPSGAQACSVSNPAPGVVSEPTGGQLLAVPANSRSALFTDLKTVDKNYSFVVWGYNRSGCTATNVAQVTVRPAPERASAAIEMRWVDDEHSAHEPYVVSVSPSNPTYKVRAVDQAGKVVTPEVTFSGSGFVRQIFQKAGSLPDGLLAYGTAWSVQVASCKAWGCGPFSATVTSSEPAVSLKLTGLRYDWTRTTATDPDPVDPGDPIDPPPTTPPVPVVGDGRFSWTGAASNNGLPTSFSCQATVAGEPVPGGAGNGTCTIGAIPEGSRAWLEMAVTTGDKTLTRRFAQ
ncbi:Ig-like domain-containing protein [Homoserinimonas sp. OAct 916]|uniref:Ig-like domain-containing protein n=1 Tax=Homoserinimonas sp. OAct 916 TaxID=2211450 RepID=UPI0018E51C70|nr:Ig-like domain-containing protein [Homoserinimonas sp. OAct 916]